VAPDASVNPAQHWQARCHIIPPELPGPAVKFDLSPSARAQPVGTQIENSEVTFMLQRWVAVVALALLAGGAASAKAALTEKQVEGVETAIKAIGCTVEESDITAKGDGYKADDVECKDGQYDMLLDKDFKITKKTKED
jgi:hypothetical protein